MKTIPQAQFAVVRDRERRMIVFAGTIERCQNYADILNREYQSTAYVAERWKEHAR